MTGNAATEVTTGLGSHDPHPPGAALSLIQREYGMFEGTIDRLAFQVVSDLLHDTAGTVWVTLFVETDASTYTRYVGQVAYAHLASGGKSDRFEFVDGEVVPVFGVAGIHL